MKKSKKIISVILVIMMALSFVQVTASAQEDYSVNAQASEYICAPSQYTNSASYGMNIQNTLNGIPATTSLGNFGGYVIYKFNEPVYNNAANPYGVDFIVTGNAFNGEATTQEPGQVWVSQNGSDWYAVAGSEHYENSTDWNYSVTYNNSGDAVTYTDSYSDNGSVKGKYPSGEIYNTVSFSDESLTLSGVLLSKQMTPSTANGIETSFGYVDTRKGQVSNTGTNPYTENPKTACTDGQIDISLAVDEYGMPANLTSVNYVKVQTATFIDAGIFGEKSTEINAITLAKPNENPVGKTAEPTSVTIGSEQIQLNDGQSVYNVNVDDISDFTVKVNTQANVYINNQYTTSRTFSSIPDKGIIRVIIQSDDKEPLIYYFLVSENTGKKTASVTFSCSDADVIIPKCEMNVTDGIAEEYGYDVAKADHNGKSVETATFFDALVSAHKQYYGDSFTPETADDYLTMTDSFITKAFGKSASASGFLIDGIMMNDSVINDAYGTYTAYACDTARLEDGNDICYYFYQDKSFWSDFFPMFDKNEYTVTAEDELSIHIDSYCAMYYGVNDMQTIKDNYLLPVTNGKIYSYSDGKSELIGSTDSKGNAVLKFEKEGSYLIYVTGSTLDSQEEECPLICSYSTVTVTSAQKKEPTFFDKLLSALNWIINIPVRIYKFIIGLF